MSNVASIAEARRRRAIALRVVHVAPPPVWSDIARGWTCRSADDGDVWMRHGLRERVFEACRLGRLERPVHCLCCLRPLHQGEVAYREADPPTEAVSWREVRICARCVEGALKEAILQA